jgi:hypothetical protein
MKTWSDLHPALVGHVTPESIAALERQMMAIVQNSDSFDSLAPCLAAAAAQYHLGSGGQRIRAILALHAGNRLGLSEKNCQTLAAACELLHNASLITMTCMIVIPKGEASRASGTNLVMKSLFVLVTCCFLLLTLRCHSLTASPACQRFSR